MTFDDLEDMSTDELKELLKQGLKVFLKKKGYNVDSDALTRTPERWVKYLDEFTEFNNRNIEEYLTTFDNNDSQVEKADEIVLVKNVPVRSTCEHHILPFFGVAHVAYIPSKKIIGLSKISRIVDHYARTLQIQERLTNQVADFIEIYLKAKGVFVMISAIHTCMLNRGVKNEKSKTITIATRGRFISESDLKNLVLELIKHPE